MDRIIKLKNRESELFSKIIVEAMLNVKQSGLDGNKYSVKNVNILKCHGKSILESQLINGYAIYTMRGAQGMPLSVKKAKIACLDMNLNKYRMQMGIQILIDNPEHLEKIRQEYY